MIRDAVHADVPAIVAMGAQFFSAAGWEKSASWCPRSISETLERMIAAPSAILLVAETASRVIGMAGALTYPAYFNAAQTLGSELFWWVDPACRHGEGAAMLEAMEARARDLGCVAFIMGAVPSQRADTMARLYARRGYEPAETTFIKAL